ncbi:hypothetical protein FRC03_012565 [Tulasnella sp. 419]|nr:hypothetical protein FRC03_012565 [Tulasnella sp. 419]
MSYANPTVLWRAGAILTATGVITGAFGAHALKRRLTVDQLSTWSTASQYAIMNGVALLAISQHPRFSVHKFAGPAIAFGATLFSGTIFALVLNRDTSRSITPLGSSLMIAGYIALAL